MFLFVIVKVIFQPVAHDLYSTKIGLLTGVIVISALLVARTPVLTSISNVYCNENKLYVSSLPSRRYKAHWSLYVPPAVTLDLCILPAQCMILATCSHYPPTCLSNVSTLCSLRIMG